MRVCTHRPHSLSLNTFYVTLICCQLVVSDSTHHAHSSEIIDTRQFERLSAEEYNFTETEERASKKKRQTANPDFTWKATKTPKFVTTKTEKHPEPVLRVYPPDAVYRSGRSRELTSPQRNVGNIGRRVIYYATLPEVVRYPPNGPSIGERYTSYPMTNQQRSFGPSKGGKEFVTRVQSSIIDVRPRGENKKEINSTPTFTIIDANPTPLTGYSPYHRIHTDYNLITSMDKPGYNAMPTYYNGPKSQYELLPQNHIKTHYPNPYYNNLEKNQYQLAQYQYQQQTNPYLYNEIGKIPSPYYSPPYPSRHTRFPIDRYPITSPLSAFDVGLPPTSAPALSQSNLDFNNGNFHSYQPSLGYDSPSTTFSSHSSGLDFNGNLGASLDHGLDFDDHHTISPLKDKFLDYNTLSQKYFDFNGLNNEFPFKYENKDPFKFDKEPFKGPFSQVSDWLTSKPFDFSSLDFDDPTNNRDYQFKGSAHSVVVDSQMVNHNATMTVKDSNNTIITPFTSSNSSTNLDEGINTSR